MKCISARSKNSVCKRSYSDKNGLGGAVVGFRYQICGLALTSLNITPTSAVLAHINNEKVFHTAYSRQRQASQSVEPSRGGGLALAPA